MKKELVGEKIKKVRKSYNLSQARFGKKIGVSGKTISAYETGKVLPPLKVVEKISETYEKEILSSYIIAQETLTEKVSKIETILAKIANYLFEY